jgi:DNA polymerase
VTDSAEEKDFTAESSAYRPDDLANQVRQHLQSLRDAGVEWLPLATLPGTPHAVEPAQDAEEERGAIDDFFSLPPTKAPSIPLDQRRQALQVLAQQVAACTRCPGLASTRTQTVFGVGSPTTELCFIGEAPGADEDAQGEPFVGAAGQLLNRIIAACGMKREEVYICNIIKCRPPGNRAPQVDEAAHCSEYLTKQLELVAPKFICCLGSTAARYLLNTTESIGKLRGRFHDYRGTPVLCTYHPAYLLPHRSPDKKKEVWEDMKMLLRQMGRSVPA